MNAMQMLALSASVLAVPSLVGQASAEEAKVPYVRLAELEIDPAQLEGFKVAVQQEIKASIRIEPGVLALYAVSLKDNLAHVRVFEMYTNSAAYAAHLETPHFRKFKAETQNMVKSLKLLDATPIALGVKAK